MRENMGARWRAPSSAQMEIVVKSLIVAVTLSLVGPLPQSALAQHPLLLAGVDIAPPTTHVRFDAPVGHRQPSAAEIEQGKSAKDFRSPADISVDDAFRRTEDLLRKKLIICKC